VIRTLMAIVALSLSSAGCSVLGEVRSAPTEGVEELLLEKRLSEDEQQRLQAGERISHPSMFHYRGGKYIAGISYMLVEGRAERILEAAGEVTSMRAWLPFNRVTEVVGRDGDTRIVKMVQGFEEPLQATLHLRVTRRGSVIHWQLDPELEHEVDDAWGYVLVRPYDARRSLMVVGLALDLGDGVVRQLLEKEVHQMLLWATDDARRHFEVQAGELEPCGDAQPRASL
jgi:hypothetical protein